MKSFAFGRSRRNKFYIKNNRIVSLIVILIALFNFSKAKIYKYNDKEEIKNLFENRLADSYNSYNYNGEDEDQFFYEIDPYSYNNGGVGGLGGDGEDKFKQVCGYEGLEISIEKGSQFSENEIYSIRILICQAVNNNKVKEDCFSNLTPQNLDKGKIKFELSFEGKFDCSSRFVDNLRETLQSVLSDQKEYKISINTIELGKSLLNGKTRKKRETSTLITASGNGENYDDDEDDYNDAENDDEDPDDYNYESAIDEIPHPGKGDVNENDWKDNKHSTHQTHHHHHHSTTEAYEENENEIFKPNEEENAFIKKILKEEEEEEEDESQQISINTPSSRVIPILPTPTLLLDEYTSPPVSKIYSTATITSTASYIYSTNSPILSSTPPLPPMRVSSTFEFNKDFVEIGSGFIPHIDANANEIIPPIDLTPIISIEPTSVIFGQYKSDDHNSHSSNSKENLTTRPELANNLKLHVQKQPDKVAIYSGRLLKHEVRGSDYFLTQNPLELSLDKYKPEWIELVDENTLIGLPLIEDISDYRFNLSARDIVTNLTGMVEFFISVRQNSRSRNYYYDFELLFDGAFDYSILNEIGEKSGAKEIVYLRKQTHVPPYKISFLDESLVMASQCPIDQLKAIWKPLNAMKLKRMKIQEVNLNFEMNSVCGSKEHEEITGIVKRKVSENFPPTIKKPVDTLELTKGELFVKKLPDTFCYDPEDGYTNNLKLELVNSELDSIPADSWIGFDQKNQEIFAIQMNEKPNVYEFVIVCSDSQAKSVNDAIEIVIRPGINESLFFAELSLHFEVSSKFDLNSQRKFVEKLAKLFKDDPSSIVIKEFKESNNIVHFKWFNKTNPRTEFELTQLRKVFLSNEGGLEKNFVQEFSPDFNLSTGSLVPKGRLIGIDTPIHFDNDLFDNGHLDIEKKNADDGGSEYIFPTTEQDRESEYLVTYIIPSVLIVSMVLIAAIIACLLARSNQVNKENQKAINDENTVFIKKGVPVILQEELEEEMKMSTTNSRSKSPAIMRDERPPGMQPLPPEYRRSPGPEQQQQGHQGNQASYQPPPPILSNKDYFMKKSGSSHSGTHFSQRRPPPYVAP